VAVTRPDLCGALERSASVGVGATRRIRRRGGRWAGTLERETVGVDGASMARALSFRRMLIVLSGLPAVGKSSIARGLAQRLRAVHLRIDTIEQTLRATDVLKGDVGRAGYAVAYALAEENLRLGAIVIADAVNGLALVRDAWRAVATRASVGVLEVEIICSDIAEHERRATERTADIAGLRLPTWPEIRARRYDKWDHSTLVIDTASSCLEESVGQLAKRAK
jgi:predicted kinase